MKTIQQLSKSYYLKFNIPLQVLFLFLIFFFDINWLAFLIFYISIYWIGVQAGTHKLFSHKSWVPKNNFIKYFIAILGCFGLMGGPITWAKFHRWHHRHNDSDHDPHSPKKGLLFSYFGWLLNPPDVPVFVIKDYIKDKTLIYIEGKCREIVVIGLTAFFIIDINLGLSLLLAMILTFHSEMLINTFLHKKVNENFEPINNLYLSIFSGGGSLHKNHHINAGSPNFSNKWYEFDLSYFFIKLLQK